jgi:hypothetical protein
LRPTTNPLTVTTTPRTAWGAIKGHQFCIFLAEGQKWPSHYRYLHGLAKNVTSFLKVYSDEWVLLMYYDDSLARLCPEESGIAKAELEALSSVELHSQGLPPRTHRLLRPVYRV